MIIITIIIPGRRTDICVTEGVEVGAKFGAADVFPVDVIGPLLPHLTGVHHSPLRMGGLHDTSGGLSQ